MFSKTGEAYERMCKNLGLPNTCKPSIPISVAYLSSSKFNDLKRIISKAVESNKSVDELTTIICAAIGPRPSVYTENDAGKEARGFFVVSNRRLRKSDFACPRMHILMFKGGKCKQVINHYHYVFTTEWNITAKDIRCIYGRGMCNITPIVTSTGHALNYIINQLAEGESLQDDSLTGYSTDEYYAQGKVDKIKQTNDYWHQGSYDKQFTSTHLDYVTHPDCCDKSVYAIRTVGGLKSNPTEYRGEYYLYFTERNITAEAIRKLAREIEGLKARAYFVKK